MKKLWLLVVLISALSLLASGPQATSKAAGSTEGKSSPKAEAPKKGKRVGHPVDIDITPDAKGKPTAPDVTLHRKTDDRAHWKNQFKDQDCSISFSPFGLPNHKIPHGGAATSGPIVGPDGKYEYVIVCGAEKAQKKAKTGDPAIIVTN